jgi:metallo-beta-lactamase family protein
MFRFLKESNLNIHKIALVHGEEDQSLSFAKFLNNQGFSAIVPKPGDTLHIE